MAVSINVNISIIFLCLNLGASAGAHDPIDSNRVFLQSKGHWHSPLSHFKKLVTDEQRARSFHGDFTSGLTFWTSNYTCVVHAVHPGSVQAIFRIADYYAVMVRYGSYFITYSGLDKPDLREGDLIRDGQGIGTLYTDSNTQDGELEIILSGKNSRRYDPEKWFDWKSMPKATDTGKNASLVFDTTLIAIIPFDLKRNYYELDDNSIATTLTQNDLGVIDSLTKVCFESLENRKYEGLSHYRRQYVAVINPKGEKEVYIKAFCSDFGLDWKKWLMVTDDGGLCFWSFKVNLTTNCFYDFMTGGYA